MGTEYYLVDHERQEVLDVGKWYELEIDYGAPVTMAQLAAANPHPAVLPWAEGRTLVVISDSACMEPWIDHDDPYLRWRPGWRVWELIGADGVRECYGPRLREELPLAHAEPVGGPWWPPI